MSPPDKPGKRSTAALLALFLGPLGAHKFYTDRPGEGVVTRTGLL